MPAYNDLPRGASPVRIAAAKCGEANSDAALHNPRSGLDVDPYLCRVETLTRSERHTRHRDKYDFGVATAAKHAALQQTYPS